MSLNLDETVAKVVIATWDMGSYLVRSPGTRHSRNVSASPATTQRVRLKAKVSGNYSNSNLAKTESVRLVFDEAIMLDPRAT
jgi:branched-chain amino acid aminotransferase